MADPATTARVTPLGIPLKDGHSTKIAFEDDPDISFWEKTVSPPGIDGGDPIDFSSMHNLVYTTFTSRALVTLTECTTTVFYDPDMYDEALNLVNVEGSITIHFPDLSTLDFWGYMRSFIPDALEEGSPAEATIVIQPTNWDPVNNVEASPVMTEVAGT